MTCREFADFIADYLTGELPPAVHAEFEHHLDVCINCRRYLKSYEETITLGRRAFEDEDEMLPAVIPEELVQAILASRPR
jgi:anti-sigma factor RsiW